MLNWHVPQNFT
jgi:hypothetical protein